MQSFSYPISFKSLERHFDTTHDGLGHRIHTGTHTGHATLRIPPVHIVEGVEVQGVELLGVQVPTITIPVTPGRNLAVNLEVAAMNNRQKRMGYNAAVEFTEQINRHFDQSMNE